MTGQTRIGKMDFLPRYTCSVWKKHFASQHVSSEKKRVSLVKHVNELAEQTSWKSEFLRAVGDDHRRLVNLFIGKPARGRRHHEVITVVDARAIVWIGEVS